MKILFSAFMVVSFVAFLAAPGLTKSPGCPIPGPGGPGGPINHVTVYFEHDTQYDMDLNTDPANFPYYSAELNQTCGLSFVQVDVWGDIFGPNVGLSDVYCFNSDDWFAATKARVELMGIIVGTLAETGEPINISGRMTLDIDLPADRFNEPHIMKGYWIFQKGVGTHYGAFCVEGIVEWKDFRFVGSGTYKGWVRKNP
jgi:hypothetical protein